MVMVNAPMPLMKTFQVKWTYILNCDTKMSKTISNVILVNPIVYKKNAQLQIKTNKN